MQGRERVRTLSVQRPHPHTANPWKEEKDKTVGDKKERADHANRKALTLLLKPASPTPSNTGSLRSLQRDTERGTKLLRYWEVLQRGDANKSWKEYNEFQLTKNKMDVNTRKGKIIQPPPSEESHSVTDPLGKTVEETADSLSLPNIKTIIINKIW